MLVQFEEYLTFDNIYLWANFGVVPFWFMLIFAPSSRLTQIFINSIILPLILASAYVYIIYQAILLDEPLFEIFKLYLSLDNLYTIFATESFLLVFWLHFLSLNLFLGSWVSRNAVKYNMNRIQVLVPLILIYISGPLGLTLYWFIRIFYSKKLGLHD